jgi:hypothetical protein
MPSVTGWSWFDVLSNQAAEVAGQFTDPVARNAVSGFAQTVARIQEWLNHP